MAVGILSVLVGLSPAVVANLAIPYAEGFESAAAGSYVTDQDPVPGLAGVRFEKSGNARLVTDYGDGVNNGALSVTMDTTSDYARGDVILQFDLAGYDLSCNLIELDFAFRDFGDENHQQAGAAVGLVSASPDDGNDWVFVRGSSSDPWIFAYNWGATASSIFKTLSTAAGAPLDIRQLLLDAGQSYSTTTEVMLRWYDNAPAPTDGVSFDDVQLGHTQLCSTLSGQLGIDGNATGLLGQYEDELAVPVQVELQDGVCTPRVDCPVATTDADGIYTFPELLSGNYSVDVYDEELPSDFILSIGTDGDNATSDPMPVTIANPTDRTMNFGYIGTPVVLPYAEDFEGAGAEVYHGEHHRIIGVPHAFLGDDYRDGAGRARMAAELAPGFYHSGSNAVTFDTDAATNQQNNLVFTFDMSAYDVYVDTVLLDFAWMHHGDENSSFDRDNVEVRGSTNDPWITLYDKGYAQQSAAPGVWIEVTALDLSDALLINNVVDYKDVTYAEQQFSKTFQIRFNQYDNADATSLTGGDGATYDDICIYLEGGASCSGSEIGDRVWNDLDGDGVDDPGEPGIPDITVTLLDDQGGVLDTDFTDDTGAYKFILQTPGTYTVVVTPPAGALRTFDPDGGADDRADVAIASVGDLALGADFGYQFTGSLTGAIWDDRDADGVIDPGETGIGGVTVELRDGATVPRTTTTDPSGQFTIAGVGPGSWTLFLPAPPVGADATHDPDDAGMPVATPHRADFSLANGEDRSALDFGYRYSASISGSIWDDIDEDGVEDAGETGLSGVTVTLELAAVPVQVATTDSGGDYAFSLLPGGSYSVIVDRPAGTNQTLDPDATVDDRTSLSLAPSELRTGVDFAYHVQASIGGRVWNDADGDGSLDGGETGLDAVSLELRDGVCSPGVDCPTTLTDSLGDFEFQGLSAGVAFDIVLNECTLPWAALSTNGANPYVRTLNPLEIVTDANFGYRGVTLPLFEGFENAASLQSTYTASAGCLPAVPGFSFAHDNTGRLRFAAGADMAVDSSSSAPADNFYRSGNGAATLDTSASGATQNDLKLSLDLSAYSASVDDLILDFAFMDHIDDQHPTDVVDMKIGASPWIQVFDWGVAGGEEVWTDVRDLNLSQLLRDYNTANATSFDFPDGFELRFRQYGVDDANYPSWGDGVSFDDVFLRVAAGTASISGALWKDLDSDTNRDTGEGMACALLELYEDTNGNGVLDGAEGASPLRTLPAGPGGAYQFAFLAAGDYLLDIVDATLRTGMSPAAADPMPLAVGAGQVISGADLSLQGGVVLPYSQDFEGATQEVHWGDALCIPNLPDFEFTEPDDPTVKATAGRGRLDFRRGEGEGRPPCTSGACDDQWSYKSGEFAATLDENGHATPDSEGNLILHLDLSNYDVSKAVTMDFSFMHHAPLFQTWLDFDALVYIRGSAADPWLLLYDIEANSGCGIPQCLSGQWQDVSAVDLSGVLLAGSQDFSATTQIRFHFYGTGNKYVDEVMPWGQGGYTIDDIVVNGPGASTFEGTVWNDLDGSGAQNGAEVGLPGLQVELRNASNELIDQTTTSAAGSYQLAGLETGDFTVIVTPPPGGANTLDPDATPPSNHAVLTVPVVGVTFADIDFGYQFTGLIAGTVFDDADGSMGQDGGEVGFPGVSVTLWSGAVQYDATTTDGGGNYGFAGLPAGVWTVVIGAPPAGTAPTVDPDGTATLHSADIAVGPGQTVLGQDFGYMHTGSISGSVFDDRDGSASRDGGEDGFVGVPVSLLLGVSPYASTVTDASGGFGFGALPPGSWRLVIDAPPSGTQPTSDPDGLGSLHFADLTLAAGQALAGRDFGYRYGGSIAGTVFDDADGSQAQDGGELGFVGVPVSLKLGATTYDSTTTAGDGSYGFSNLPPGTWTVVVDTPPAGSQATVDPDGIGTLHRADVALSAGQVVAGRDFGYRATGSIAGTVFDDADGSGAQNGGEAGFAGVPVSLLLGATPHDSSTTDSGGGYSFSNLPAGSWTVRIDTPPVGTDPTVDPDGTGTAHTADVTLTAGQAATARDFGYRAIGSISGEVFDDANGNTARDGGEPGFAGVTVALLQGAIPVDSTTTAADGSYSFSNLSAGSWTVRIDTPPAGTDATVDPDGTGTLHTADVTLTAGQSASGHDFGYRHSGSIAGVVFDDVDGSGVQNGEPGFVGVPVTLLQGVTPVDSTTTAGDGSYSFGFLPAGTFTVRIDTPPAGTSATADPDGTGTLHVADVTLTAGESSTGRNFGYRAIGAISGTVFDDANGNAGQDGGEAGFAGLTVALLQGAVPVDSTTTAADGSYSFSNLAAGSWTVQIDTPPAGTDATVDPDGTGTLHTADVTLTAGQSASGRDFGYRHSGSIAGVVFDDADGSGAQNGEPGFVGVPVSLLQGVTPVDSTTTAGDGSYSFGFLPAGTFTVRIDTPPAGTSATADPDGTATLHVADVTLTAGESSTGRDFGYRAIGAISGTVFDDANGSAGQDGGEAGFAGLTVALLQGAVPVDSTTTAADGSYSFSNLAAGTWTVQIDTPPAGADATVDPDGTGTVHTADVTLTAGQSAAGRDFGYRHSGSIAGVVFDDADGSGAQNGGEPGFAGVPVSLLQGVTPVDSTTTAGDGSYSFGFLPAGTFTVRIDTPPAGTSATADPDGTATLHVADVTLTAGESSTGRNFGYRAIGAISGAVFDDANGNAGQDGGEAGFAGLTVALLQGAVPVDSTTTAADGSYSFSNLAAGTWTVRIDTPPAGTDATVDPDGTGTLHTADVTLTAGQSTSGRDFGYRHSASIAGVVFDDADGSGVKNGGEPGFAGVPVSLLQGVTPVDSTTTSGDGSFSFSYLPAGTFTVRIDTPPAGTEATVDPDGTGTLHVADVTLTAGESSTGRDFGYRSIGTISGTVFDDADGSAGQNGGETGFSGVGVSLLEGAVPVDSTTTAGDGSYSFANLAPGTFTVVIDTPPAGTDATVDPDGTGTLHTADVTLTAGQSATGRDFGYRHSGSIAGVVFDDGDGSGAQNGGEPGFVGVPVSLLQGVTPVDSTTTAGDGSYSFSYLPAGTFTVRIDTPPAGTEATADPDGTGTLHVADVTLAAGESSTGSDFGYRAIGTISGRVFDDADGNGSQNGAETGFAGLTVSLLQGVTPVDSTTTSGDGSYSFTNLAAGTFTVLIDTPPAGTSATGDPDGTATLHRADVTLLAGQSSPGNDFGYRHTASIAGVVFEDADGSFTQNGGEPGFAGVPVSLLQGVTPVDSTTTAGDGSYSFAYLPAGTFTVVIDTPPAGTSATVDPDGVATLHQAEVTLAAGQSVVASDFGYRYVGSISGYVFEDADGSGAQNGAEAGFTGVAVSLLQGATPVDSTTTAADGSYSFSNLSVGTWTVRIDAPPAGTDATADPDGTASLNQADISLTAGQSASGRDFGYRYNGSIAGSVFEDLDGSATKDGGEPGFAGTSVSLLLGATPFGSTTTAADGSYSFSNLPAGNFRITIDVPPAGTEATTDPDGPGTLHQADLTLTAGQSVSNSDFGYRYTNSIAGSVFEDADGSTARDGGEAGFAGVSVSLLQGATPYESTTTAADGSYGFSNLPVGTWTVVVDSPPAGTAATTDPDGTGTLHRADISLTAGQSVTGQDFGYRYSGSIAGLVFEDTDGSTGPNGAEPGFAGVPVSLLLGATPHDSTTTAGDGTYSFANVPPGTFTVVIDTPPAGTAATVDPDGLTVLHRADVVLTAGQTLTAQDFGYRYSGSIAGTVFDDADGSAAQNGAESGFESVPVSLMEGASQVASTTTDTSGDFSFSNLAAGTYTVVIDTPPAGTAATVDPDGLATLHRADIALTAGQVITGRDFGYRHSGSIAGTVFDDADGSTAQNGAESGFESVPVSLMEGASQVASTTTDTSGDYSFSNLPAGTYTVVLDSPPAGTAATADPDGLATLHRADVPLTVGQTLADRDFGYRYDGSIAGTVFEDADGSTAQNGAESGFDAVGVSLMLGAVEQASTSSDTNGDFTFENLAPGDYTLVIGTPPAGTDATVDPDGLASLDQADVTLTASQSLAGQDFGYRYSGSLAGTVFEDADGNGAQNGEESGFESVGVSLMLGAVEQDSTSTDASGDFSFENVPPGDYILVIDTPPAGTDATTDPDGTASLHQADISLTAGQSLADQDFGYRYSGSIAGTVFDDADGNQEQNGEESGFESIEVSLMLGAEEHDSTTTDASGDFSFENVPPGDYILVIDTPPAGTDATTDPDGTASLHQADISLAAGQALAGQDFGYRSSGSIAGTVFDDADGNEAQNGAEAGFEGVPVSLELDEVEQDSTATDVNGDFSFENLPAGDYTVVIITPPAGTDATVDPDGLATLDRAAISLAAGEALADRDFGYRHGGSIAGTVFDDADGSGGQNGAESGFEGVPVLLMDGAVEQDSTSTDVNGEFSFENLPAGDYTLVVDTPPAGTDATADPDGTASLHQADVTLTAGQSLADQDFGYRSSGSIAGTVFEDTDGSTDQNGAEPGLENVPVSLLLDAAPFDSTLTASDGTFTFANLPAGSFTLVIDTPPANSQATVDPDGTPTLHEADVTLTPGQSLAGQEFGYRFFGTIGDLVWEDSDLNGIQNGGEAGLAGVTLDLTDTSGTPITSTTTDANGAYSFDLVFVGDYRVVVTDSGGVLAGKSLCAGANPTDIITIAAGTAHDTADFGYCTTSSNGSIGDLVFLDADTDGDFGSSESGLGTVEIELWRDQDGSCTLDEGVDTLVGTTTTDSQGGYLFSSLSVPATYHVRVTPGQALLDGFGLSLGFESVYCTTLSAVAPADAFADFGFVSPDDLAIDGTVFLDASGDGVFDSGSESGVGGAVMTLYRDLNGNAAVDPQDPILGSMASQPDGDFTFGGLPGGGSQWIVHIDASSTTVSGGVQTTQTATGGLEPVTLFSSDATGRDFGYTTSPTHALVTRFDAVDEGGQVVAEWQTTSEVGTVGFYLYRWNESLADWSRTGDFVAAAGSALGATYRVADAGALAGEQLSYYLVEVELRGGVRYYGPYERQAEAGRGSSVLELGVTPHRRDGLHLSRTEARRQALAEGGSELQRRQDVMPSEVLRLTASGAGVHSVSASVVAAALGASTEAVEQRLADGGFALTLGGERVSWWSVDGRGLSFYAPESESLFSAGLEFFLEIGEGAVAETRLSEATARVEGGTVTTTRHLEEDRFAATDAARGAAQEFWFWRALSTLPDANSTTLDFALDTPRGSGEATLRLELYGATETPAAIDHRVGVWLNGRQIDVAQWNGTGRREIAIEVDTAQLRAAGNELRLELEAPDNQSVGIVYLDSIEIDYRRSARLDQAGGQSILLRPTDRAVTLGGFVDGAIQVLDVTDPLDPVRILGASRATTEGFEVDFAAQPGREYVATGESAVAVAKVTAAQRSAGAEAEYLVIASSELSGSAERLAELRRARGLKARVVSLEALFDTYAGGEEDPWAVRSFLQQAWNDWQTQPRWVALVGKGSFDFKDVLGTAGNLLPPPLVSTAHGLFAADMLLGDVAGDDGIPEIAIGRIPVVTAAELDAYVDKLADWEAGRGAFGTRVILASDNADEAGDFPAIVDSLRGAVGGDLETMRVDLGADGLARARADLLGALEEGALWMTYAGHGGVDRLAAEGLLTLDDAAQFSSAGQLPIVSALTCALNRYEVPGVTSLGEALVLDRDGGAIAVFAPTGLSQSSSAASLGGQLMRAALGVSASTLGEAVVEAMITSGVSAPELATFTLLGDPALALPEGQPAGDLIVSEDFEAGELGAGWTTKEN